MLRTAMTPASGEAVDPHSTTVPFCRSQVRPRPLLMLLQHLLPPPAAAACLPRPSPPLLLQRLYETLPVLGVSFATDHIHKVRPSPAITRLAAHSCTPLPPRRHRHCCQAVDALIASGTAPTPVFVPLAALGEDPAAIAAAAAAAAASAVAAAGGEGGAADPAAGEAAAGAPAPAVAAPSAAAAPPSDGSAPLRTMVFGASGRGREGGSAPAFLPRSHPPPPCSCAPAAPACCCSARPRGRQRLADVRGAVGQDVREQGRRAQQVLRRRRVCRRPRRAPRAHARGVQPGAHVLAAEAQALRHAHGDAARGGHGRRHDADLGALHVPHQGAAPSPRLSRRLLPN